jgi:hypothetical protein
MYIKYFVTGGISSRTKTDKMSNMNDFWFVASKFETR